MQPTSKIKDHFESVFNKKDPWSYESEYEIEKRKHLISLIPLDTSSKALEVGCAEGHFTSSLASRVGDLTAVDVSAKALSRAKERCAGHSNISFVEADVFTALPDETFDLIVCSEVLYYVENIFALRRFRNQLISRLKPSGKLVLAHAHNVTDDKTQTGFDFNEIGTVCISRTFSTSRWLSFERELTTGIYRMQVFRRLSHRNPPWEFSRSRLPAELTTKSARLTPDSPLSSLVKWGGCKVTNSESRFLLTSPEIPILAYHRIADAGPDKLKPYRVSPSAFERQLAYLKRNGFTCVDLKSAISKVKSSKAAPPGRLFAITFDDAYEDFFDVGLPLLKRYGFLATVFVPTHYVGGFAEWDSGYGEPAKIMSWDQIREAARQGINFGAHTVSHPKLPEIDLESASLELEKSRDSLSAALNCEISDFCYPFNQVSKKVEKLVKEAGYSRAFVGHGMLTQSTHNLRIPRQEVFESEGISGFVEKLGVPGEAPLKRRISYLAHRAIRSRKTYMNF